MAATANSALSDAAVRHATYLQRYGAGVVRRLIPLLNRAEQEIVARIQARIEAIAANGWDSGPATTARLKSLLGEIRALNQGAYRVVGDKLIGELKDLAGYESQWQAHQFGKLVPVRVGFAAPAAELVVAAALKRPFQGRLLKEWLDGLEAAKAERVRDAIRLGIVEGKTSAEIIRSIRGTRTLGYADGLMEIDRRGAAAMVRTAVNHVATAAREETFARNEDVMQGVQWVATLDGRTCPTCQALDGRVFAIGEGPRAPAHIGCRCTMAPVLKSWKDLGVNLDESPEGTRASLDGQVPDTLSYQEWLTQQDAAFQDEVLGKGRAELFRSGMGVERFVDRNGSELTLKDLRNAEGPPANADELPAVPSLGGTLSAAQVAAESDAIDYVSTNGARDNIEYASAYFADGAVGLQKSGEASAVSFSDKEIAGLKDSTLVHNHPRGSSLSGADLIFAGRAGLREIIAVPSFGPGLYRATPLMAWGDVSAAHQAADAYVMRKVSPLIVAGRLSIAQAEVLHWHLVNKALDYAKVVAYKANLTPALEAAIAELGAERMKAIIEGFAWKP